MKIYYFLRLFAFEDQRTLVTLVESYAYSHNDKMENANSFNHLRILVKKVMRLDILMSHEL